MTEKLDFETMTFRQGMNELNRVVALLEGNQLELEESLDLFVYSTQLIKELRSRLADAEQKIDDVMGNLEPDVDDETRDTTIV